MGKETFENVRLKTSVVELVRENKKKTGVSIGHFIEELIQKKLIKPLKKIK